MKTWASARGYRELAVRLLVLSLVLVLSFGDIPLTILLTIVAMAIDLRHPMSLKNFFLVYALLLFGVGTAAFHLPIVRVVADAVGFVIAFLAGYWLSTFPAARIGSSTRRPPVGRSKVRGQLRVAGVQRAMVTLLGLDFMLLLFEFSRFGVIGYYRGEQLVDQFLTYGKANAAGGAEQIIRFGLTYSAIALVVLYSQACLETAQTVRYRYAVGLLVVTPILFLHRFDAVIGAATCVAVYACERRANVLPTTPVRSSVGAPVRVRAGRRGRARRLVVMLSIFGAFGAAVLIGGLRGGALSSATQSAPSISTSGLLTEEFTPVQAYAEIKANHAILKPQLGKTIFLPLLFKVIPRAWFPNKPLNSGAYYMSVVRPAEFKAGFALPPTFFGDAILSFGRWGGMLLCSVLGFITARIDIGYKAVRPSRIPLFLIFFANYYGVMRFPISESLAGILLTLAVWRIANRWYRSPTMDREGDREDRPVAVAVA